MVRRNPLNCLGWPDTEIRALCLEEVSSVFSTPVYMQAAAGGSRWQGSRRPAAQPAARDAAGGLASHTVTPDGALASGEDGLGSAGAIVAAAAASSDGVPASSEGDATSAGHMNMHMHMPMDEVAEVEPPKSKRMRVRSSSGRSGHAREEN
jgi:hypothetical protein